MLRYAAIFFVIAIIAAVFGFGGIAGDRQGAVLHLRGDFPRHLADGRDAALITASAV